jgi:7-cyano-7-deazaguanine synthase in queuosine biosynthesis
MAKDLAVILNNGSINSAVTTALAAQKFRVVLLYAEVGGEPGPRARVAYETQVTHFKPYRDHTLPMPYLTGVEHAEELTASASDPRHPTPIAPAMIDLLPLIAIAMRFAVHYQATAVYTGLRLGHEADKLAQATEYSQIWNELMQMPCNQPELMLETPLLELEPWQVIDVGFQASAPFEKTWTCTEAGNEPCWACRACRAREAAFQQAAKADPLRVLRKI